MYLLNPSDPRRRSKIFAFVKFFGELEHAEQFLDGNLFMRRLSYYRRKEDAEGRWDSTEGMFAWLQKKGLQIQMTLPTVGVANITERDLAAPVSMSLGETDDLFIFCMYAYNIEEPLPGDDLRDIYGDDRLAELEAALHIDPKCLRFGPHAVVVPYGPFMQRLKRAAIDQSLHLRGDLVRYYDDDVLNGNSNQKMYRSESKNVSITNASTGSAFGHWTAWRSREHSTLVRCADSPGIYHLSKFSRPSNCPSRTRPPDSQGQRFRATPAACAAAPGGFVLNGPGRRL
jgi:hypothetical protein